MARMVESAICGIGETFSLDASDIMRDHRYRNEYLYALHLHPFQIADDEFKFDATQV